MKNDRCTWLLFMLLISLKLRAYNLEAHAEITFRAFGRSQLSLSNDLLQRLGLDRLELPYPFNNQSTETCGSGGSQEFMRRDAYIDAAPAWLETAQSSPSDEQFGRCPTLYEQRSMPAQYSGLLPAPQPGPTAQLRIEGWLMRGVIREDDFESGKYDNPNLVPDRDPWDDSFRSVNHFYDPVADNTSLPFQVGQRSAAWALGVADDSTWSTSQVPDPTRGNHFSYMDARKQLFLALTYKDRRASPVNAATQARLRLNLWATTFKSLGHVIHLLQDTASPQHVRGEGHSFLCNGSNVDDAFEQPIATRTFENFSNYRVTVIADDILADAGVNARYSFSNFCDDERWRQMFIEADQEVPRGLNAWQGYPIPMFSVQRKFFTTRNEDPALNSRRGLADYSNRGFFTEGHFMDTGGLTDPNFTSPPPLNDPSYAPGPFETRTIPGLGTLETRKILWQVPDAINPTYPDIDIDVQGRTPVLSESLWTNTYVIDGNIVKSDVLGGNLTLENYTQIADMLAPRAVAYSAGLLDFFFRGRLEVSAPVDGLFSAMNHGFAHTADADGVPRCVGNITVPENWCTAGRVFGFTKSGSGCATPPRPLWRAVLAPASHRIWRPRSHNRSLA